MIDDLRKGTPDIMAFEQGARWTNGLRAGGQDAVATNLDLITTFAQGAVEPELLASYQPGSKTYKSLWGRVIDEAEAFNEPGRFTAFIGFEWTSLINGNNMHRVVCFAMRCHAPRRSNRSP